MSGTDWRSGSRRELLSESAAGALFLCLAVPTALAGFAEGAPDAGLVALLVVLYALASRAVEFPLGGGYVVPSYAVLVPMLLLLPPGCVPLLAAAGLLMGDLAKAVARRESLLRLTAAVPDAWPTIGPAAALLAFGSPHGRLALAGVYCLAFLAGCLLDLLSCTLLTHRAGARSRLRASVFAWAIDACFAPLGLLLAWEMREDGTAVLLVLPLGLAMALAARDRDRRIAQAQSRLELLARERARLQGAVGRLGDALAAKLDLRALADVVLRGSVEALDCDGGRVSLTGPIEPLGIAAGRSGDAAALRTAAERARADSTACQLVSDGVWALALPFGFLGEAGPVRGAIAVARRERPFRHDEQLLMEGLVERAREAAADILAREELHRHATTDSLTRLGNRRKLLADVERLVTDATPLAPLTLVLFDLDGFKQYNDAFGHPAGDALLERLSRRLEAAAEPHGAAYRLGGDEFCALVRLPRQEASERVGALAAALTEIGENYAVTASHGSVSLPAEAVTLSDAMLLADERMYSRKRSRSRRAPAAPSRERAVYDPLLRESTSNEDTCSRPPKVPRQGSSSRGC